jgi:nucleoside-diphosphate-sugar epimerase
VIASQPRSAGIERMSIGRVTVFGGSGFLGRRIVARLAGEGAAVRIAVRHPERVPSLTTSSNSGPITAVCADVWDAATVEPAVAGADAVVNTVGHYVERGPATFEAIHGRGAMHVARAAAKAGVRRLFTSRASAPTRDPNRPMSAPVPPVSGWSKRRSRGPRSSVRASCSGPRTRSSISWPRWRG